MECNLDRNKHLTERWSVDSSEKVEFILSTSAFKIKRFPSGLVRMLKARFYVRGDLQKGGVDVFEIFAPVILWNTVRLVLIMSMVSGFYDVNNGNSFIT